MIHITLSEDQLQRIVNALQKNCSDRLDSYLINYLENVKKMASSTSYELDWDEVPF